MPYVVSPCVLSKGGDVMSRPTSFDRVCCPKAVMSCHARCCRLCEHSKGGDVMTRPMSFDRVCFPKTRWHAMPDVVRPFVLLKGDDGMPRPTSFDRVCFPKEVMECRARRRSTVCAVQRRCCHATPDVVRLCVLPKGSEVMPRPTSSYRMCCRRAVMACHTRRRSTVCDAQRR